MKSQFLLLSIAFAFLVTPTTLSREAAAFQRDWDCRIFGRVSTAGQAVAYAKVTAEGPVKRETYTDATGRYAFRNLQPGTYLITVVLPGFRSFRRSVEVRGTFSPLEAIGEKRELNIALDVGGTPSPQPSVAPSPRFTPLPSPAATLTPSPSPIRTSTPFPSPLARLSPNANANRAHVNLNANTNTSTENVNGSFQIHSDPKATSASIDEQINALIKGKIVYDIPTSMSVGKTYVVKVGVAKELTPDIAARATSDPNVKIDELPINDVMDVDLISEEAGAFDVLRQQPKAGQPGWQVIGGPTASEWIFSVSPVKSGTHKLRLVATVQLNDPKNQNQPKSFNVYENDIAVSTDYFHAAGQFFANYWQWLLTFIIVPVGGYGIKLLKNRMWPPPPAPTHGPDEGD
ncbi:MAG TPA: carboxypeptidase regulatory-like domain-containing protein [Pyrinomonadaceae bacterium]|nr:carboxypeptidase regulatory-like domain-containing protein [Pyrinomonadaceae bacterium]